VIMQGWVWDDGGYVRHENMEIREYGNTGVWVAMAIMKWWSDKCMHVGVM
jgi:hypothetical protein